MIQFEDIKRKENFPQNETMVLTILHFETIMSFEMKKEGERRALIDLKAARKEMGMTAQETAERAGIPRSTYSNIETGVRNPSVKLAKRISAVLGFDWNQFFEDESENPE